MLLGIPMRSLSASLIVGFVLWMAPVASARTCDGATRLVALGGNLRADDLLRGPFDGSSLQLAFDTSNFSTTISLGDSRGTAHDLTLFFTRIGPDEWTVAPGVQAEFASDTLVLLAPVRTLRFNARGRMRTGRRTVVSAQFSGATPQRIVIDLSEMTQRPSPSGISGLTVSGCVR